MKHLSEEALQTLVNEFYTESREDIVGLFAVAQAVEDLIGDEDAAREQALRIVERLLCKGMLAGDSPCHPAGYHPWPDQERSAVMHRIQSEWKALGHSPSIPDIAWFGPPTHA